MLNRNHPFRTNLANGEGFRYKRLEYTNPKNMKTLPLLLTTCAVLLLPVAAHADEPREILLWPDGAPGSEGKTGNEIVRIAEGGEHIVSNIHKPSITPYLPAADKATGCAVIVVPGGAHRELWMDHEGYNVAHWLSEHGIAAFILKYRLARETNSTYTVDGHALADIQRALRLVRSRATEWGIATNRIGVLGFSAGGEVAFLSAMRFDNGVMDGVDAVERQSSRPDFQALLYPGSLRRIEPATNSPPAFLACGANDQPDISEGLASVYLKFKQLKVPVELHIYAGTGHGFGLRPNNPQPAGKWIERFDEWLAESGFLKKP